MKTCILFIFLYLGQQILAYNYTFERLTSQDGLSQNNVLSIHQCSDGYMWFASYDGLNRYDGYDFKVYRYSPDDTSSISSNLLGSVTEDSHGYLWVSTFNSGICRFNKKTEKFTAYKKIPGTDLNLSGDGIIRIVCDSDDNIWVCMITGLVFLETHNGNIIGGKKIEKTDNPNSLVHNTCYNVLKDSKGQIFIATRGGLELMRRGEQGEVQNNFYHLTSYSEYSDSRQISEIPEGYLLSHNLGLLLLRMDLENPENVEITPLEKHYSRFFTIDTRGDIWSVGDNGLFRLERTNSSDLPYKLKEHFVAGETEGFLSNNSIRSIIVDKGGLIWMGTNGAGIMKCNAIKAKFRHYKKSKEKGSLTANQVWSIFEDPMHNLWFSTQGGGLNLLPASKNKDYKTGFKAYAVNPPNEQNFAFQMIDFTIGDMPKYLAGAGYENKLVIVKQINNDWKVTPLDLELTWQVMAVCKDEYGAAWLGTYNGGLLRLTQNKSGYHLDSFGPDNCSVPSRIIRSIFEDSMGRLWIGTDNGIAIVRKEEKKKPNPNFEVIKNIPGDSTSLSNNYVVPIMETSNNEIWIGTFGGALNRYIEGTSWTNGSFIRMGTDDGLPNNTIKQIIEDDLGNLWVSSNKGLSRIDTSRKNIRNFDLSDGVQDLEFTDLSGTKLSDGELIFGGVNGFNAFYPNEIYEDTTAPDIVFTELEVMNHKVEINKDLDGQIILSKAINYTDSITLEHYHNSFTIYFAAIHYAVPSGNRYKYMLEGFDNDWIRTSYKSRFARYTNIEPGQYTFKLQASNSHGVWVAQPKQLTIIIKPPFWETWWFISIALATVISGVFLFFYSRTRQMRKRNMELEKEVEMRTKEIRRNMIKLHEQADELNATNTELEERQQRIEEQAEELRVQKETLVEQRDELTEVNAVKDKLFSIVAHDLKNPFTTLLGFLDVLDAKYDKYSNEKRRAMLGYAISSAKNIQTLLINLLSWARAQSGTIKFKPETTNIIDLMNANVSLVTNQATEKGISIEFPQSDKTVALNIDTDLINTVIRNLLTNAVKFTTAGGTITLNCSETKSHVVLKVQDSGIGISEQNMKKLFKKDTHFTTYGTNNETGTGLGLITCKDFIAMHKGELLVESKESKGTTFTIIIPKG